MAALKEGFILRHSRHLRVAYRWARDTTSVSLSLSLFSSLVHGDTKRKWSGKRRGPGRPFHCCLAQQMIPTVAFTQHRPRGHGANRPRSPSKRVPARSPTKILAVLVSSSPYRIRRLARPGLTTEPHTQTTPSFANSLSPSPR